MLLLQTAGWGQGIWGGAGFFYGGQSIWPGFANAIQQASKTTGLVNDDRYCILGVEMYVRRNRWIVGAGASALVNKRVQDMLSQSTIESSASNAHIWIGWVAWQTKRLKLYPSLGPGLSSFTSNSTTSTGVLTTNVLDGFSTDVGLTFDWFVFKTTDPTLQAGPMLSLRAGYRLTTASNEWHGDQHGATIVTPIRYGPHGFFITLGVGGGGFRYK
ncbi:hypothetical protein G8759_22070 [Spirosoma aureum]|uniref:Outer membrane beta-barrel protein n=1 Tax=Spirosoma aureum TaxID=2692134 RepID=A0A6G9AS07_9BACT|nr:hypothetical protein [Spirosoma aureum]QIP15116.1 hypothetical protein G8759_22070 [Spirosoma aureum]